LQWREVWAFTEHDVVVKGKSFLDRNARECAEPDFGRLSRLLRELLL